MTPELTTEQTAATAAAPAAAPAGTTAGEGPVVVRRAAPARVAVPRELPGTTGDDFSFTAAPAPAASAAPRAAVRTGPLWTATCLATAVLTAFFVLIVSGRVVTEGPVLLVLTRTHGIHLGDLVALAAWCLAVGALVGASALTAAAARRR